MQLDLALEEVKPVSEVAIPRTSLRRFASWSYRTFSSLPATFRAGFALLASGGLADIAYHLFHGLDRQHSHGSGFDLPTAIHLLVAAGMLVTLAGLAHAAVRPARTSIDKEAI